MLLLAQYTEKCITQRKLYKWVEWLTDDECSGHPTSAMVNNAGQDMDLIQENRWGFLD